MYQAKYEQGLCESVGFSYRKHKVIAHRLYHKKTPPQEKEEESFSIPKSVISKATVLRVGL